jgi:toxin ParE1/3/4
MRLQWADTAHEELFRAADFLDDEGMGSSAKMLEAVLSATNLLVQHPQVGPAIMGSRIRKWPVADHPFLLLYEVDRHAITIVRFVHNRSDWQSLL